MYTGPQRNQELGALQSSLQALAQSFDGRVGIGVQSRLGAVSVNGNQKFSLQSVMKLLVATTVMDAVDRRGWQLSNRVLVRKQDLSLNVQPLAALIGEKGYATTIGDLVFRAVVESDSAATDILFARVGGATAINRFLARSGIQGVRVDRDERHLQTETVGLTWRPEYVHPKTLERAKSAVSRERQAMAFRRYLKDERDTATPVGMTSFLYLLASERILTAKSSRHLLDVMRQTVTFPDRLKAGTSATWKIAHKTGTSGTWEGVNGTTNDVGVLTSPRNQVIAVSVFVAESRRSTKERAEIIAEVAHRVTKHFSQL